MRKDVQFPSRGSSCHGWLYLPNDPGSEPKFPAIVMAHGFSAVKEMFLDRFAECFRAAGFAVLAFDFRFLGESPGEPRGQIFPTEQHEDYRNAISWLARQPEIDAERIGAWGSSYSGGHVLHLAAFDRRIKAAVAQVPALGIWRQTVRTAGLEGLRALLGLLTMDRVARYPDGEVNRIPVVGPPGSPAILGTPDAYAWFQKQGDSIAPTWQNAVTVESVERMIEYDPAAAIELIAPTPLRMIVAEQDSLISIEEVEAAFRRARDPSDLVRLECGHFDVYDVEPWFSRASEAATEWFVKHLGQVNPSAERV
ncbi:MAG: alpha/beta hydrolase [bacterium]|nr:alpha/beta hydrolase [bacterium]MCP5066168.1 alpha/beta hydrolase [bacterium]